MIDEVDTNDEVSFIVNGGSEVRHGIVRVQGNRNLVLMINTSNTSTLGSLTINLSLIHIFLDEADEMLNMGFKEDIEEILSMMPADNEHQTILFSATWPQAILKITEQFQKDPVRVEIKSSQRTIDTVEQIYYEAPRGKKANALRVLLNHYDPDLCMIFCNTKKMVDELCDCLLYTSLFISFT